LDSVFCLVLGLVLGLVSVVVLVSVLGLGLVSVVVLDLVLIDSLIIPDLRK